MRLFDRVYDVLYRYPTTRDSDKLLLLEVWETQGLILSPEQQQKFMGVATAESVTRARRKIQETEFKPSKAVADARAALEREYKQRAVVSHIQAETALQTAARLFDD